MAKYRWTYAGVLAFILGMFLCFGNRYLLLLFCLLLLLIAAQEVLLRVDSKKIVLSWEAKGSRSGKWSLSVAANRRSGLLAAGLLEGSLRYHNVLFDRLVQQKVEIPLNRRAVGVSWTLEQELCGEMWLSWDQAVCYDLTGLCRRGVPTPRGIRLFFYPRKTKLSLNLRRNPRGYLEGERYQRNQKGNDLSETFDLREYIPGDDVRAIHWKLSGKLDRVIIREASQPSGYDVMVFFDGGLSAAGILLSPELVTGAIEAAATVSEELMSQGVPHYVGLATGERLEQIEVTDRSSWEKMLDQWMGMPIQPEAGTGLKHFLAYNMQNQFTRVIYITAGAYPEELNQALSGAEMTIINIVEEGSHVQLAERGRSQLIEIPRGLLQKQEIRITV